MDILRKYKNFDWVLLGAAVLIFAFGLLCLFSATYQKGSYFIIRQLIWFLFGALIFMGLININYRKIVGLSYFFYGLVLLLLAAVLFIGSKRMGAQRWLDIGFFSLQPSEFAKLFVTLAFVQYLANNKARKSAREIVGSVLIIIIPLILIMKEPDLGTALMFVPMVFILLYVWGVRLKYLFGIIGTVFASLPFMWFLLKDYQKERLLVFINPDMDPLGAGYTVAQSKIAIGSGGILGKGWLSGTQSQLNFLAERHTDFIFSVAGEEWGFLGCAIFAVLYYILIKRALSIASKTDDPCGVLTAVGLASVIGIQVIVNICMTMGFMPVVGVPLPFVSYGGSSLLVTIMAIGILESIAIH